MATDNKLAQLKLRKCNLVLSLWYLPSCFQDNGTFYLYLTSIGVFPFKPPSVAARMGGNTVLAASISAMLRGEAFPRPFFRHSLPLRPRRTQAHVNTFSLWTFLSGSASESLSVSIPTLTLHLVFMSYFISRLQAPGTPSRIKHLKLVTIQATVVIY